MAPYGVQITKRVTWRGQAEEFSNVWHYDTDSPFSTEGGWEDLVNQIVAQERPLFRSDVTFARARVYGPTDGTQAENQMRFVKDLSGAGTGAGFNTIPFEMAVVAQFYVGRGPRGGKVYIRKYFHSCGLPVSTSGTAAALGNGALNSADKTPFATAMTNLKNLSVGGQALAICTPGGRHLPVLSDPTVLNYLHVRQFRR